jgi:hypothetical protein
VEKEQHGVGLVDIKSLVKVEPCAHEPCRDEEATPTTTTAAPFSSDHRPNQPSVRTGEVDKRAPRSLGRGAKELVFSRCSFAKLWAFS